MKRFFKQVSIKELPKPLPDSLKRVIKFTSIMIVVVLLLLFLYGCNVFFDYYRLKFQLPTPIIIEKRQVRIEKLTITPIPTKIILPSTTPEPTIDPFTIPAQPAK